ncbi:3-oxoacyl-[acyl-carrier-protein] reductase FabG [Pseudocercospora fuligena]|uniref:3-oxoacyl-[acyl-carrier-protein] reductase FabG n=1 Tax=Pseudocercospora fuligena TaxID=685502 RepID=A0A8H6VHE2_9PEZI|nr:3-oxoacyl-[acyl-carrier-protein] reductase FabG [Pseudocercospora fuligena]
MPDFTNKLCIITGAASGIGRATAIKMASHGSTLALSDINMKGLEETRSLCQNSENHSIATLDVGSSSAVNEYIEKIGEGKKVDFVFNCAGVNPTAYELTETTDAYWDKLTNTNLRGTYNITRACIPKMSAGSSLVNVSSIMGTSVAPKYAIYCATKWGIVGFTKAMALELGPKNIRINAVAPGYIDTPSNAGVVAGAEAVKEQESKVAMGRMGTAEEVADVVCFLFGDEARYVTGSVVEIHGGRLT